LEDPCPGERKMEGSGWEDQNSALRGGGGGGGGGEGGGGEEEEEEEEEVGFSIRSIYFLFY